MYEPTLITASLTDAQAVAILFATYFLLHPLHAFMCANVAANHRTAYWRTLEGWFTINWKSRSVISVVTLLLALLWTL